MQEKGSGFLQGEGRGGKEEKENGGGGRRRGGGGTLLRTGTEKMLAVGKFRDRPCVFAQSFGTVKMR